MSHRCVHFSGVIISSRHMRWGMEEYMWKSDPKPIQEFVEVAHAEGWQPSSIDVARLILKRYNAFTQLRFHRGLDRSGWREFAAYKAELSKSRLKRSTIKGYLIWIVSYYRLRAESTLDPRSFNTYVRVQMIGRIFKAPSEPWKPFSPE